MTAEKIVLPDQAAISKATEFKDTGLLPYEKAIVDISLVNEISKEKLIERLESNPRLIAAKAVHEVVTVLRLLLETQPHIDQFDGISIWCGGSELVRIRFGKNAGITVCVKIEDYHRALRPEVSMFGPTVAAAVIVAATAWCALVLK